MPSSRILACALAVLSLLTAVPADAQEIQWRHDYETARREAREKGKPLVIEFGTANCTWCRKLEASTFHDPAVVEKMNEQFVALKIDAEASRKLTGDLNIKSFPTVVFAAADGRILGVQEGYIDAAKFAQQLRRAQTDAAAEAAAAAAPPASPPALAVRLTAPTPEPDLPSSAQPGEPATLAQAEKLARQLGDLYLNLAENALRQDQPQQAVAHLERVLQVCPGTDLAQAAERHLHQLHTGSAGQPPLPQIRAQSK